MSSDSDDPADTANSGQHSDSGGESPATTVQELNAETGLLSWDELIRYFARGVVVRVDSSLDLVEVAKVVCEDNSAVFEKWVAEGLVARATDDDARLWNRTQPAFWAVVTAPWVLVQQEHKDNKQVAEDVDSSSAAGSEGDTLSDSTPDQPETQRTLH